MNWWDRWRRRQNQLAQGVDANLVRENQKRYRFAFGLLTFGFALSLLISKTHLQVALRSVVSVVATVCGIAGFALLAWSRQEAAFLSKPEPEEPPKIFK
jgi:hypothetical protein